MKKAFTLTEVLIVLTVMGVIAAVCLLNLKPNKVKYEALMKGGKTMLYDIDGATRRLLAKNSIGYSTQRLVDTSGAEFSIGATGSTAKMIELYKQHMKPVRGKTLANTYGANKDVLLKDEAGNTYTDIKVSYFPSGYFLKNGGYFALKVLSTACTSSISYTYNPNMPSKRTTANSCGAIFYDVNGEQLPNTLGIDQYIVAVGKMGIK